MPASTSIPFPDSDAFRARLRQCADKLGSANALAKAAGIPQSTIHKYFVNSEPSRHNLIAMARAAQVSVEWLACGTGSASPDVKPSIENPEEEQAFQQRFDQVLTRNGGINGLASITQLPPDRLAHVKAGGEFNRQELKALNQHAGVSIEWLITGKGQAQLQAESPSLNTSTDEPKAIHRQAVIELLEKIQPPSNSRQSDPVDRLVLVQRTLAQLPAGPLIPFLMDDDTMEPTLNTGDLLFFSPATSVGRSGIHLFRNENGRLMVARAVMKGQKIVCRFENKSYAEIGTFEYLASGSRCLGRLSAHLVTD